MNKGQGQLYPYHGQMLTIRQAAEMTGIKLNTLRDRIYKGMTMETAIEVSRMKKADRSKYGSTQYSPKLLNNPEYIATCTECRMPECKTGCCYRVRACAAKLWEEMRAEKGREKHE